MALSGGHSCGQGVLGHMSVPNWPEYDSMLVCYCINIMRVLSITTDISEGNGSKEAVIVIVTVIIVIVVVLLIVALLRCCLALCFFRPRSGRFGRGAPRSGAERARDTFSINFDAVWTLTS